MQAYERRIWSNFDVLIAVSENDKKYMNESASADNIFVIPNGIDVDHFQNQAAAKVPLSLIYTGQMGWYPNEDAVIYFVNKILPSIKKRVPDVQFLIVGGNATKRVRQLGKGNNGIQITGHVNDILPYIDKAAVFVVPLRIGSGTRIKILEAFALGKPVISTSIGCEGLEVRDGENILIADEPNEFAKKTTTLLNDELFRKRLGDAGRKLVKEKYDWEVISEKIGELRNSLEKMVREN